MCDTQLSFDATITHRWFGISSGLREGEWCFLNSALPTLPLPHQVQAFVRQTEMPGPSWSSYHGTLITEHSLLPQKPFWQTQFFKPCHLRDRLSRSRKCRGWSVIALRTESLALIPNAQ